MGCNENNYIVRLKKGREDALEFVVDRYLPLVKGIAGKVLAPLGANGLIEECINDIFFSVWEHAEQFQGEDPGAFRKWLCGVSRYRAIDFYRKQRRRMDAELLTAAGTDGQEDWNTAAGAAGDSAEDLVMFQESRREVMKMLELLEPMDQEIFVMKFFLGMKSEEISKRIGLTKSSVDNRIYRGKKKLSAQKADAVF